MTPQEVLAILSVVARQQIRISQLEAEIEQLQEALTAAVTQGVTDGVSR